MKENQHPMIALSKQIDKAIKANFKCMGQPRLTIINSPEHQKELLIYNTVHFHLQQIRKTIDTQTTL